jgi:hypothetical protein
MQDGQIFEIEAKRKVKESGAEGGFEGRHVSEGNRRGRSGW